jgi:hypothetical protein
MAVYDTGKMILFVRSIMWDLGIPQEAATVLYEDNDACTAMGNAQKPTMRTRHIDIKYFSICEWIERDLMILERIDTSQNPADHFTKNLPRILFHRHVDYIMGHVPPPHSPHFMSVGASGVNTEYYPPTAIVAMVSAPRQSPYSPFIPICLPGHWCNKS